MKKTIFLPMLLLGLASYAQDLNPEVQVTNDYVTKMMDVSKQQIPMCVPDSMLKFDYHFDYSVFESPYKGAYEFTPYAIGVTPDAEEPSYGELYVKAGAGWSLHPELEAVWSPVHNSGFDLSVFESFGGFAGNYRTLDPSSILALDGKVFGCDLVNRTGVEGRWNLPASKLRFEAGYDGIFTGTEGADVMYNSAYASFRAGSNSSDRSYFFYDAGVSYRFLSNLSGESNSLVSEVVVDATIGPVIDAAYRILADFEATANGYHAGFSVTPRFEFLLGPVNVSVGARLGYVGRFSVYPDIRACYSLPGGSSQLYALISGRDVNNSFSDIKSCYHWYTLDYGAPEVSRERISAAAGIRGSHYTGIQYDLRIGGRLLENSPLFTLGSLSSGYFEKLGYADYGMLYADAVIGWKSDRIETDAHLLYRFTGSRPAEFVLLPAAFTGNARFVYNIERRVFAGAGLEWSTSRTTSIPYIDSPVEVSVPGYADLSIWGEYRFSRMWSLWLKGGNLLGSDIRHTPLHSEKSPYVTAGFRLAF